MKVLTICFMLLLTGSVLGQQPAKSPLDELSKLTLQGDVPPCDRLPERVNIRGLRLHQSLGDAMKAIPLLRVKQKRNGVMSAELDLPPNKPRPDYLKDVQIIRASFLDRTLYAVAIVYRKSSIWNDPEEFVWTLTQKLGLPDPSQWKPNTVGQRMLDCGSENIRAGIEDGYPIVMLFDRADAEKLAAREKEAAYARQELIEAIKDEERAKFKP